MTLEQFGCILFQGMFVFGLLILVVFLVRITIKGLVSAKERVVNYYYDPKDIIRDVKDVAINAASFILFLVAFWSVIFVVGYVIYLLGYGGCS